MLDSLPRGLQGGRFQAPGPKNSITCIFLQQTTISLVSARVEVVRPFGMGPKTGPQISIPARLFPFLDRGNYSRGSKNGVLVTS
jgi:hypothetical protein